eukprot:TRINITY_DN5669_c0_g1_i1.p2 TRINITY_DN5669_c0_g1~~TRINITY_DN5669_c0_g1_i1.p2  ORF type:complete len:128 (+),score=39.45 TRINITY_DN5669_c0_g1_i1:61-444(+)
MSAGGVSLSQLYHMHEKKQERVRDDIEKTRRTVIADVERVTEGLVEDVNGGAAKIFLNQRVIEKESRQLDAQCSKLNKQSEQWMRLLDGFNDALKEVGDVENWSRVIENDMKDVVQILEFVHKQQYI